MRYTKSVTIIEFIMKFYIYLLQVQNNYIYFLSLII